MNNKVFRIVILIVFIISAVLFINSGFRKENNDKLYQKAFKENYRIFTPFIPEKFDFADEEVPTDLFFIRERLDKELLINTYWHNSTILIFKNANRYFPVIEPILEKNGVPDDFKYLALIESRLTNVVSPAGAVGFWQILKKTGQQYGLRINEEVDERYHIEKSTEAACKYLLDAYKEFGNWTLVAASYNAGVERIKKAVEHQKEDNYYLLYLNTETSRYLYRIIAMKTIFENPTDYGFYVQRSNLYPPLEFNEIKVSEIIPDLVEFADSHHIDYLSLKIFNPWMRTDQLSADSNNNYIIKIPDTSYLVNANLILEKDYRIFGDTIFVEDL